MRGYGEPFFVGDARVGVGEDRVAEEVADCAVEGLRRTGLDLGWAADLL